jgi:hypothetical protein
MKIYELLSESKKQELPKKRNPAAKSLELPQFKQKTIPNKKKSLAVKHKGKAIDLSEKKKMSSSDDPCWKGYHMVGKKKKNSKEVPNCVPGKKGS